MEKRDIAFKRLFPTIQLSDKPIVAFEWPELQARKKELVGVANRYLVKVEKSGEDYQPTDGEREAVRLVEDMIANIDHELNVRLESGDKGPRTIRIDGNGKTRNAARTGGELRSGEVGLRPEELFGPGDMGPYASRDDFYAHVLANQAPEARNMVEGIGAQGGFTVPTQLHREILNSVYEESVTVPFLRQFRMDTLTLNIPMWDSEDRSQGGIASFEGQWIAEATDADIKTPKLRLVTLTAHKLMVLTRISRECISDSFSLGQQLQPTLVKSLAYTLDAAIIGGGPAGMMAALRAGEPMPLLTRGGRVVTSEETGYDPVRAVTPTLERAAPPPGTRSNVPPAKEIPQPPFWGSRIVRGVPLRDIFPFINTTALFRGQWQYQRGQRSEPEYAAFVENEVQPVFRRMQEMAIARQLLVPQVVYGWFPARPPATRRPTRPMTVPGPPIRCFRKYSTATRLTATACGWIPRCIIAPAMTTPSGTGGKWCMVTATRTCPKVSASSIASRSLWISLATSWPTV